MDDLKNIWQYVISHRRTQELTNENDKVESFENNNGDDDHCSNMALGFDSGDEMDSTSSVKGSCKINKKAQLIWLPALHERFLTAIHHLGFENAVPKTIHELMNVPGLSRQNVASHLQDPEFYQFLQEHDKELLDFNDASIHDESEAEPDRGGTSRNYRGD